MIPLKLQLKNFLSYGSTLQTIDFTPYNLICLSGRNGHGKSALLDAITWALWGQARKISGVAKADTYLLRLGQQQMLVIFDFEFNGHLYRIRREFALTHGKQYASLDFGLLQNNNFISLTNKTIRETQETIETTVGLDFESFINSAFLRQGQSNEFSKKSPKERKDILGAILGLQHYEVLKKRANEKVKNATIEISHVTKFQEKLEHELQKLPEITALLQTVQQELHILEQHEKELMHHKERSQEEKNKLLQKKNQLDIVQNELHQKKQDYQQLHCEVNECHLQWKHLHRLSLQSTSLLDKEKQKQQLIEKIAQYQRATQKGLALKEQFLQKKHQEQVLINQVKHDCAQKLHTLELNATQTRMQLQHILEHMNKLNDQKKIIEEELLQNKEKSSALSNELKSFSFTHDEIVQEKIFEKRKMIYYNWLSQANHYKNAYDDLVHKQKFTADETNPSCPLCEQNLSASRKKFLKLHFSKQESFLKHRLKRLSELIKQLKQVLTDQHAFLQTYKKNCEQKKILEAQYNDLITHEKNKIAEYQNYTHELEKLQKNRLHLEKIMQEKEVELLAYKQQEETLLHNNTHYLTLTQEMHALQEALNLLQQDQEIYNHLLVTLEALEKNTQSATQEQELAKKAALARTIQDHCRLLKATKIQIHNLDTALEQNQTITDALAKNAAELLHNEQAFLSCQQKKETLLLQKGRLEKEHATLCDKHKEHAAYQIKIKELQELVYDYHIIANAVSKDGIQALIIEQALPEIEQEANNILGQLTDNQAQIIIESLRDLKKGGTKETLDIKISDSVGIRSYELFSGGEAFRIDFALRLAISKLLARRAGTSLQTLIIDEGFGSQDEEGLSHIMDALYKIQDNFCKIIIVSHLPSMKDQFPVHFFVEKGAQGSAVRVIEQG